jgi:hypothetical protein
MIKRLQAFPNPASGPEHVFAALNTNEAWAKFPESR